VIFDRSAQYQAYSMASQTVPKTRQIVMLYDGVIRFMQQAKEAIVERRIEDRYKLLVRASDVVVALQTCLDHENGGEISKILHDYYTSIDLRIMSIHRSNSLETCDRVISELKEMRNAWHQIDTSALQQVTPPTPTTAQEITVPTLPKEQPSPAPSLPAEGVTLHVSA
jgi:flagellar protein FliS